MCPNCNGTLINRKQLATDLEGRECSSCGGLWIPGYRYAKFLERRVRTGTDVNVPENEAPKAEDSQVGKTCPDCGKAIVGRRLGHGTSNHVERCDNCYGIWLDKGEWEILTAKGLEDKVNHVFTHYWQSSVRKQVAFERENSKLREILGKDRSEVVIEFRRWLDKQPDKAQVIPYLY